MSENNQPQRSVAQHVRDRQRAVAEREASRLARPSAAPGRSLAHANRRKAAVTSTPFGVLPTKASTASSSNEWCGPLAMARQMIAAREQARAAREEEEAAETEESHPLDAAMEQLEQERKRKEHPSLQWKPSAATTDTTTTWYAKRIKEAKVSQASIELRSGLGFRPSDR